MNHITLAVKDIEKAFAFYHDTLGLTPLAKWDKGAYFLVGPKENGFWFCLNVDEKRQLNPCYTHYAFGVDQNNFERLSQKIVNSGAQVFKENTSPGNSLYFLDPDGHKLELHVGDWKSRIEAKKANIGAWKNVEWFV
jgi:catechol 2,3-dioxygenase-like lactoylglutathione lyase family enzyme